MMGPLTGAEVGIIPRLCAHLFAMIEGLKQMRPCTFKVEAMYCEIYNEKVAGPGVGGPGRGGGWRRGKAAGSRVAAVAATIGPRVPQAKLMGLHVILCAIGFRGTGFRVCCVRTCCVGVVALARP